MMKNWMRTAALLLTMLLLLTVFASCAKPKEEADPTLEAAPTESATDPEATDPIEPAPENYLDVTGVDFSSPTVTIAADDFDGMMNFAKSMQNYEIPEGTVVELYGFAGPGRLMHTINVPNKEGNESVGTSYEVVGDITYPEEDTPLHLIGVVRFGEYYPLVVVPAELYDVGD